MTIDPGVEQALRETFGQYAETVTTGPAWRAPQADAETGPTPVPLWGMDDGDLSETPAQPPRRAPRARTPLPSSRRWLVPVIAAATVAAVAITTVVLASEHDRRGTDAAASVTEGAETGTTVGAPAEAVTVDADGAITVAVGAPSLVLDIYTDALCPVCADFVQHYGPALAQAVADGRLAVRYRFVAFLDESSASGDYSTRAYAALLTVARDDEPEVFTRFYAALFDPANQPLELGASDLPDDDLAALAGRAGASAATQQAVAGGAAVDEAHRLGAATFATLRAVAAAVGRSAGVPTVAVNGTPVSTNSPGWLSGLLISSPGN